MARAPVSKGLIASKVPARTLALATVFEMPASTPTRSSYGSTAGPLQTSPSRRTAVCWSSTSILTMVATNLSKSSSNQLRQRRYSEPLMQTKSKPVIRYHTGRTWQPARMHEPSRRKPVPVDDYEWEWSQISEADWKYLTGPRNFPPRCPWCHGHYMHSQACTELRASWEVKMPFGKHKGRSLSAVPVNYLEWLLGNRSVSGELREAIRSRLEIAI
jgi:uncharacterized protein (DUF3820 family)